MNRSMISKGELIICGIGIDRPNDMTLATAQALKKCDVLFYSHGDGVGLQAFLKTLCPDVRVFSGRGFAVMNDRQRTGFVGRAVCGELRRGRKVAYVTYGHPLVFSDGGDMAEYCRARGHAARVIVAPSAGDSVMALLHDRVDFRCGFWLCSARQIMESNKFVGPRALPGMIFGVDQAVADGCFVGFCGRLRAVYAPDHPVYGVKCQDTSGRPCLLSGRVGRLPRWEKRIAPMMTVVLPALK